MSEESKRPEGGRTDSGRKLGLGRGLSALFGDAAEDYGTMDKSRQNKPIPIEFVHPGRFQPRRRFDEEAIAGLVESIRERGIIQPLLVRRDPDQPNSYEIIAGERRWRAAQLAGLHEVPAVVRELDDREALELSLIENIQRQDLTPLEESEGYQRLLDEFQHTQENLARVVGKSRSHVANTLRLLTLPEPVRRLLQDGSLSAGHARALLTAPDPVVLARQVIDRGLNVRQTEQLARGEEPAPKQIRGPTGAVKKIKDADILELERDLSARLGLKLAITSRDKNGGKSGAVSIEYHTLDQLDDLLARLGRE
ncbi:Chromosome-partitioning protein ParB [uncultured Gammaproteobacteria bacterium]